MKCRYCSAEYQGDICPDCGTPAGMERPLSQQASTPLHVSEEPAFQKEGRSFASSVSEKTKPRSMMALWIVLAFVAAFIVSFFIFSGFDYLQNTSMGNSVSDYSIVVSHDLQKAVREGPPQAGETLPVDQYSELSYQANEFQGSQISCWVQVLYNAQETSEGAYFAFRTVSSENSGQELYGVAFWSGSSTELYDGRYLSITGTILGEYAYTDSFGYEDRGPAVYVTELSLSSYAEIFAPAIATTSLDLAPITHGECTIDLTRVEFAQTETRFYLTIQNDTDEHLMLYLDQTTADQDNRRYHWQENYEADYTLLYDGVDPGESRELILAFPPMSERWTIRLSLEVNQYPSTPFVFQIPGEETPVSTPTPAQPSQTSAPSEDTSSDEESHST